ncbi:MAG TPA: MFS transporter [Myxococcota bacterium]
MTSTTKPPDPALVRAGLMFLLAVAAAISVANLYYAQPLAAAMAKSLGVQPASLGSALMATQAGYAIGMVLLVPLGDGRERRRVIVTTLLVSVPALLLLASARSVPMLVVSSLLVGVTSSVPQMILPYAVNLVPLAERGRVVGTIMSGLLAGILLSRTASGALGALVDWRIVFVVAAALMLVLAIVLRALLPTQAPSTSLGWLETVRSLPPVWNSMPTLRRRALVGGLGFASFSVFWSMLSFQLDAIGHGSGVAGIFGAVGIAGVFIGPIAARRATGEHPARLNVIAMTATAVSFVIFFFGGASLVAIGVGVILLDAGVQASHLTNQTVIFGLAPELRSRINALYMVGYFVGGALGTVAAAQAWTHGGWAGVCALGGALALAAMLPLRSEFTSAVSSSSSSSSGVA